MGPRASIDNRRLLEPLPLFHPLCKKLPPLPQEKKRVLLDRQLPPLPQESKGVLVVHMILPLAPEKERVPDLDSRRSNLMGGCHLR